MIRHGSLPLQRTQSGGSYSGAATAGNDDAVDVDAYFGDVNGDGLINSADAGLGDPLDALLSSRLETSRETRDEL